MGENEMVNEKNGMRKSVTKQKEKSHRKQKYIFRISGVWIESLCVCLFFLLCPSALRARYRLYVHCVGMYVVTRQQINPQTNTTER